jgi:hypothetical protein
MRAGLVEHADGALAVAKHHQTLAQDARPHRVAVGLADLFDQAHGHPMLAHQPPHGRVAFDAAQPLVFFCG